MTFPFLSALDWIVVAGYFATVAWLESSSDISDLEAVNQRWLMDFVSDQLANGRRFRVLNVVDDFSREYVFKIVDFSISGHRVARELGRIARTLPKTIVLLLRIRVYVEGYVLLGLESPCEAALHPAWKNDAECFY